jgi:hypothetical protein
VFAPRGLGARAVAVRRGATVVVQFGPFELRRKYALETGAES